RGVDHLAHADDPLLGEEHVLGAAEADAVRAEEPRRARVVRRVGVRAHAEEWIISRTRMIRSSAKNMCSVRQRPMPCAPKSRAVRASFGVSAFVRTPR